MPSGAVFNSSRDSEKVEKSLHTNDMMHTQYGLIFELSVLNLKHFLKSPHRLLNTSGNRSERTQFTVTSTNVDERPTFKEGAIYEHDTEMPLSFSQNPLKIN